jgi:Fe2+ transport system protein FeoA
MISLIKAPKYKRMTIVRIEGGHGVRRRLMSLGFHKDDVLELDQRNILGGPVLIRNVTSGTTVALGRGIATKILVEIVE